MNVTVVPHGFLGYVAVWPSAEAQPYVSTLNSYDGRTKANAAIVPATRTTAGPAGTLGSISVYATNDIDVILDVSGYFVPPASASSLAFFPLAPCRVADTRNSPGPWEGRRCGARWYARCRCWHSGKHLRRPRYRARIFDELHQHAARADGLLERVAVGPVPSSRIAYHTAEVITFDNPTISQSLTHFGTTGGL